MGWAFGLFGSTRVRVSTDLTACGAIPSDLVMISGAAGAFHDA